jgi:hypothetical protein
MSRTYFYGDTAIKIKEIQEYHFEELADYFYIYSKERYEKAVKLIGVESFLYKSIINMELYNNNIFEKPYGLVAAYYRFYNSYDIKRKIFNNENEDYEDILTNEWMSFFHKKLKELIQFDIITLTILELVVSQYYKDKHKLIDKLMLLLENYLNNDFIDACKQYKEQL